jgi:hypothetical protein
LGYRGETLEEFKEVDYGCLFRLRRIFEPTKKIEKKIPKTLASFNYLPYLCGKKKN